MRLDNAANFGESVVAKAIVEFKLQRIEPKFCGAFLFGNMDVRWFVAISHIKEESVAFFA